MSYDFNADDVFEMAEQLEKNGAKFYRSAAAAVESRSKKKLLLELARMEDEHEITFASMRAGLQGSEKESTLFDPEGEAMLYLRALADTRVFFKKRTDFTSLEKIFKAAIEAEKDSIAFYLGMKELVPGRRGKSRLEAIIQEEMSHVTNLSNELLKLEKRP